MRDLSFPKRGQLAKSLGITDERNAEIERQVVELISKKDSTLQSVIEGMNNKDPQLTDAEWSSFMFALGAWDATRR